MASTDMKLRTARTIKWNLIDKVSSQVLYAVTGIVLANVLSQEDFGLVGAVLVFQAFASLFVDSGFSYALIQRKRPTRLDYSSVLWFNIAVAVIIYLILFAGAPLIARWFQGDERLIPLSRVMFLSFIINASAIVQTNRLMKRMNVKMIAVSNTVGLVASAAVGILLALRGYGAWAIVWQTLTLNTVKSAILWCTSRWYPLLRFSWRSLRSFFNVGAGVAVSSFLNTVFLNIYSFIIGNQVGLRALGYYTQADKWSKMGIMSLSQILTSSFLPVLSQFQDDRERFGRAIMKMNRFTAYVMFPAVGMLMAMATPLFHLLFGVKWDPSIVLFQILLLRGIFTVLSSLYNNYILALGRSKTLVWLEVLKDGAALVAIVATMPFITIAPPYNLTYGIKILLWGQLAASALTCTVALIVTSRLTGHGIMRFIRDSLPYAASTVLIVIPMLALSNYITSPLPLLLSQGIVGAGLYLLINRALDSRIQSDALGYLLHRFHRH
ncbi:MAG: lipopolysaccharide biosynthesis protein [Muribaculaceae bacterium]